MAANYYLTIFPIEALIASELSPSAFGAYMATGSKKGSAEQIIFAEINGNFGDKFDWKYAEKTCVAHPDGDPKHSVYLSIYRVLEHVPLDKIGKIYLTTKDGRSLGIECKKFDKSYINQDYYVYQELCPVTPVIMSRLAPDDFAVYLTDQSNKINVPKIVFANLKTIDENNTQKTGNIGGLYDNKLEHVKNCLESISPPKGKKNKTLDRSHLEAFLFNSIKSGVFIGDGKSLLYFPFPSMDEIKNIDYDWGRSALIL